MRRLLPLFAALLLGVGAAVLVACGDGTKDGIPADRAERLSSEFEDVQQAVSGGRCDEVEGQRGQVDQLIDDLPRSVDPQLRDRLRQASDNLRRAAVQECNSAIDEPAPEEEPQTQTETQPTETTTLPPADTTTEPPPTDTFPDDDTETLPPTDPEQTPPLDQDTLPPDPGGGTSPEPFP